MNKERNSLHEEAVAFLSELIKRPSFSREEEQTASYLSGFLRNKSIHAKRIGNNVLALNKHFDANKPTILLASHHDTVKPNAAYTKDPFVPQIEDGKLYGLGSNDAGGCLVSLLLAFVFLRRRKHQIQFDFAAAAEEEISGAAGIQLALEHLPEIDCAVVGEPTLLQMAVAERGLLVLDCKANGKAGHAAREEGENAIYKAAEDIAWFHSFRFPKVSDLLGPVKTSVTVIETANKAHNVVPAECKYVVDVRINELYTMDEVLSIIRENVESEIVPRSTRLKSSAISLDHPLVKAGLTLGKRYYGSPTTSDKALMSFPALKIGPGDSARSHTANEFIYVDEIKQGIEFYINLLRQLL